MKRMKPNTLYLTKVIDSKYLVAGILDETPCAIEVMENGSEPDIVEISVGLSSFRISAMAAIELSKHLSAAAGAARKAR